MASIRWISAPLLLGLWLSTGLPAQAGTADPVGPILRLEPMPAFGHAFGSMPFQQVPDDPAAVGYREDEYAFSGVARIYGFAAGSDSSHIERLGSTEYVDRMLVRRPVDPGRFSGNVLVEIINSALDFDAMAAWPYMWRQLTRAGDIWVGLTATPAGIRALQFANPSRYAQLGFGTNPDPGCHSTAPEAGVIFDVMTQTSQLLRQTGNPLNPLHGLPVKALIATGYSQGAMIVATYTNAIAPNLEGPAYDGYISIAGLGGYALNNCEALTDFASRILTPVSNGIPLMQVQTTSETVLLPLGLPGESVHDRDIGAPYRYYDVAGSGHLDRILTNHAADAADLYAAGGYDVEAAIEGCHLAWPLSRFPAEYVYDNLLARMEAWIREGQPPPPSQRFLLGGWLWPGQPVGGLRSPAMDVPTADYFIGAGLPLLTSSGGFTRGIPCFFLAIEHDYSHSELKRRYGSHDQYLEQVSRRTVQLQQQGWLTDDDAAEIVRQARAADIP